MGTFERCSAKVLLVEGLELLFQATLYLHLLWPVNGAAGAEGESKILGYSWWNALAMNGPG